MNDTCLKTLTIGIGAAARTIAVRQREGAQGSGPACSGSAASNPTCTAPRPRRSISGAAEHGRAVTRFDYSGHGESGGAFTDGTHRPLAGGEPSRSTREFCRGPQVVIGSSMGGWIALLLAQRAARARREAPPIAGMVLIAPAADFTEELMWKQFDAEVKREIKLKGQWSRPSEYSDEPYIITRKLIEDGRKHLMMDGVIETGCPVRILQGVQDPDVPWQHAAELVSRFVPDDVVFTLIKDGDHRLSRPEDIERLLAAVAEF